MGQFEKIIVLVTLFLVSVIVVFTFTSEPEKVQVSMSDKAPAASEEETGTPGAEGDLLARDRTGRTPNARTRRDPGRTGTFAEPETPAVAAGEGAAPSVPETEEPVVPADFGLQARSQKELERQRLAEEQAAAADLLLDDSFDAAAAERDPSLPDGAALVTLTGLRDTWEPDLKEYVWTSEDTWASVAERFYGDRRKIELLRQFNEGLTTPRQGDALLVPVFDGRERSTEVETTVDERGAEFYAVVDGDSLWGISKKVYGKGHLWERIFDANRNLLDSPDDVRPGMELFIP